MYVKHLKVEANKRIQHITETQDKRIDHFTRTINTQLKQQKQQITRLQVQVKEGLDHTERGRQHILQANQVADKRHEENVKARQTTGAELRVLAALEKRSLGVGSGRLAPDSAGFSTDPTGNGGLDPSTLGSLRGSSRLRLAGRVLLTVPRPPFSLSCSRATSRSLRMGTRGSNGWAARSSSWRWLDHIYVSADAAALIGARCQAACWAPPHGLRPFPS